MGRLAIVVWLAGTGTLAAESGQLVPDRFEFSRTEMAVPVKIVLYAPDAETANSAAAAAFDRIHQLNGILSDYDAGSELRRLGDDARPETTVAVSDDLWNVLVRAQAISAQSGGAFDVTVGPVMRLWRRARRQREMPSPERIQAALDRVGYRLIHLDPATHGVRLAKSGMRLDLGGIAKGYAIDEALAVLRSRGVTRAMVDAGGDVGLGDPPPGKPGWQIGVAAVDQPGSAPSHWLRLANRAIATSGDTWQFVEIDGRRYSHIVDPRTGLGLIDRSTVTVVAPDATTADALASAVSVLGPAKGLPLVDCTPGAAALVVHSPDGQVQTYTSRRWKCLHATREPQ